MTGEKIAVMETGKERLLDLFLNFDYIIFSVT